MTKPEDVAALIEKTVAAHGHIDVLVNNAGQGMYTPVEKIDIDQYKKIMDLNVFAVLRAMQAAIPHMRSQGSGAILNVSSRVSQAYYPGLGAYASTKYALNAISLTARAELEKDSIVVGVFLPRMTATNFGKNSAGAGANWTPRPRPDGAPMPIDTAEQVAEKIADQIQSGSAQEGMYAQSWFSCILLAWQTG